MKKKNRTYLMYLQDIEIAMNRIAEYLENLDVKKFKQDFKTVDAVVRNFRNNLGHCNKLPSGQQQAN